MTQIYNKDYENYKEDVLIKGCVRYSDCCPVMGAIVILEKIQDKAIDIYLTHAVTNKNGEFYFIITDKESFYKIKVFDNHLM